jgi:hypothetical protein
MATLESDLLPDNIKTATIQSQKVDLPVGIKSISKRTANRKIHPLEIQVLAISALLVVGLYSVIKKKKR